MKLNVGPGGRLRDDKRSKIWIEDWTWIITEIRIYSLDYKMFALDYVCLIELNLVSSLPKRNRYIFRANQNKVSFTFSYIWIVVTQNCYILCLCMGVKYILCIYLPTYLPTSIYLYDCLWIYLYLSSCIPVSSTWESLNYLLKGSHCQCYQMF